MFFDFINGIFKSSIPSEIPVLVAYSNPTFFKFSTSLTVSFAPYLLKNQRIKFFSLVLSKQRLKKNVEFFIFFLKFSFKSLY